MRKASGRTIGSATQGGLHSLAGQIFAGTAVLMLGALILMSFTLSSLKLSRNQTERTEDTLLEITTIEARLINSEAVLNAFVINRNPRLVQVLARNRQSMNAAMAKLGHSVSQDPEMVAIYRDITGLSAKREAAFDYLAQHTDEVAFLDRSPTAKVERALTDRLRGRLWDLLRLGRTKRFTEHTDMIAEAEKSIWIAVGIVVLALLSGTLSLYLAGLGRRHDA